MKHLAELDQIVQRHISLDARNAIDVSRLANAVFAELPPRLAGRIDRRQVCDRVFVAAVRRARANRVAEEVR